MYEKSPLDSERHDSPRKSGLIKNISPVSYTLIVLGIIFFIYQFIGGTLAYISDSGGDDLEINTIRIIITFSQFMLILAPALFFSRLQTSDLTETFCLKMPQPAIFTLSIIGVILVQPLLQGYIYFQDQLIENLPVMKDSIRKLKDLYDVFDATTLKIVSAYSVPEFIVVVFVIGVTPAVCEEMLFRGFVLSNFRKLLKPFSSILLSGFLFAIYHFHPFNALPLFVLGFYLGFVVYYSRSILTAISCHFLNNFLSAYLLFVYGKEEFETPNLSGSEGINYALMGAASLILFILILILIHKLQTKQEH
jgi:CAAX protease family protein